MLVGWHVSSGQRQFVSNNCHVLTRMIKVGPEPLKNKSTNRLLDPFFNWYKEDTFTSQLLLASCRWRSCAVQLGLRHRSVDNVTDGRRTDFDVIPACNLLRASKVISSVASNTCKSTPCASADLACIFDDCRQPAATVEGTFELPYGLPITCDWRCPSRWCPRFSNTKFRRILETLAVIAENPRSLR